MKTGHRSRDLSAGGPSPEAQRKHLEDLAAATKEVEQVQVLSRDRPDLLPALAARLDARGMLLWSLERHKESITDLEEAIGLYRRLVADPSAASVVPRMARTLGALGSLRSHLGDYSGAMTNFQEALTVLLPLALQEPAAHKPVLSSLVRDILHTASAGKLPLDSEKIAEALRLL
jgi:tetratricopeptide (TPR) repeat protein